MAEEVKMIYVRALKGLNFKGDPTTHEIQLYEVDDRHPQGRALVFGPDPVEVADTAGVQAAIRDGRIEQVSAGDFKQAEQRRSELAQQALGGDPKLAQQQAADVATARGQLDEERASLEAERRAFEQEREELNRLRAEVEQAQKASGRK